MDVEKTIEFILQMQARTDARVEANAAMVAQLAAQAEARFTRVEEQMTAIRETLGEVALIQREQARILVSLEQKQEVTARQLQELAASHKQLAASQDRLAASQDRLAASQLLTDQKLQSLIDALRRGTNGHENN